MNLTELYELPEQGLLVHVIQAMRLPFRVVLGLGLNVPEPTPQAQAWLICEALNWLEVKCNPVWLTYDKKLPEDRAYLVHFNPKKISAYGSSRYQAVLRAVLIVDGGLQ